MINISNILTSLRYFNLFYADDTIIYSTNKPITISHHDNALQTLSSCLQSAYLDPAPDKSHFH